MKEELERRNKKRMAVMGSNQPKDPELESEEAKQKEPAKKKKSGKKGGKNRGGGKWLKEKVESDHEEVEEAVESEDDPLDIESI